MLMGNGSMEEDESLQLFRFGLILVLVLIFLITPF